MRALALILTLACSQSSISLPLRPFEIGYFHSSDGIELSVEYSHWFGVQVITVSGFSVGKDIHMILYYNYYKGEFYEELAPEDPFAARDSRVGSRDVPHYLDARKYLKEETSFLGMRVIDLALGHSFSPVVRRGRIVVDPAKSTIVGIDFRISDAGDVTTILRPFVRIITAHPQVALTPVCREILRDL